MSSNGFKEDISFFFLPLIPCLIPSNLDFNFRLKRITMLYLYDLNLLCRQTGVSYFLCKGQIDLKLAEEAITKNTIAIIGVAETTAFGTIDPLIDLNATCLNHQFDLHLDAAFGRDIILITERRKNEFYYGKDCLSLG